MATVWAPLRDLTAGKENVSAPGVMVGKVIAALDDTYAGIKDRPCTGDRFDPTIIVSVDGRMARLGLLEQVEEESNIYFPPFVEGGQPPARKTERNRSA